MVYVVDNGCKGAWFGEYRGIQGANVQFYDKGRDYPYKSGSGIESICQTIICVTF